MEDTKFEQYKSTMFKMMHIGRLHRNAFENNISQMGIHHSQHHLLMYISKEGEVATQKQIAEKFGITQAAVARSLKVLESEGYVERQNTENDGRCNKIVITDKGREIVRKSHIMFKEMDSKTFEDFSSEDLRQLNDLLDKMISKLCDGHEEICARRSYEKK